MMYFDTVSYHAPAVTCAAQTVGVERLIFGTDSPNLVSLKQRGFDLIGEAGIAGAEWGMVMGGTARALLKI